MVRKQDPTDMEVDADGEVVNNSTAVTLFSARSTGGRQLQHGETPISNIPITVYSPWNDTINVRMNYYKTANFTFQGGNEVSSFPSRS